MAKAKSTGGNSKKNTPAPQESFGLPGKTYKVPTNAVKTTSLPKQNKTKPLANMQGPSNFKNKSLGEVVNAALAVTSVAGLAKTVASRQLATSAGKAARETFLNKEAAKKAKYGEPPRSPNLGPSRTNTAPYREKPSFLKPPPKMELKPTPKLTTTRKVIDNPVKIKFSAGNRRKDLENISKSPQLRESYIKKVEQYERLQRGTPRIKTPIKPAPATPRKSSPRPPVKKK